MLFHSIRLLKPNPEKKDISSDTADEDESLKGQSLNPLSFDQLASKVSRDGFVSDDTPCEKGDRSL